MRPICSLPNLVFVVLLGVVLLGTASACAQDVPDKASPFTAVRWDDATPLVRVDETWYEFVSLDGLTADEIAEFAREEYGDRWQKRFSEDLVDVLTGMGHTPSAEVALVLRRDGETLTRTGRMTEDNRQAVWDYNQDPTGAPAGMDTEPERDAGRAPGLRADRPSQMAEQFAAHIDRVWEATPEAGTANVRFLFLRGGAPFAGRMTIETEFAFRAVGPRGTQHHQGANPNSNGRWVYEGLPPGTYAVTLEGVADERFAGWSWTREVTVEAGDAPVFEVVLDG